MPLFISPHANYTFNIASPAPTLVGNQVITPNPFILRWKSGQLFVEDTEECQIFEGISNKEILRKLRKDNAYNLEYIEVEDKVYKKNVKPEASPEVVKIESKDANGNDILPPGVKTDDKGKPMCAGCGQVCKDLEALSRHIAKCPKLKEAEGRESSNDTTSARGRSTSDGKAASGSKRSKGSGSSGSKRGSQKTVQEESSVAVSSEDSGDII